MNLNYRIYGKEVALIRSLYRLTYADVGAMIGKHPTLISHIERQDKELTVYDSNKLLQELGIDEDTFLLMRSFLYEIGRKIKR